MASQALNNFNEDVDAIPNGTNVTNNFKTTLKNRGERLYIAGSKETIAHLYKHAVGIRDDVGETTERRQFHAQLAASLENIRDRYQDSWWADVSEF